MNTNLCPVYIACLVVHARYGQIEHAGIYSERAPTSRIGDGYMTVCIAVVESTNSYMEAKRNLFAQIVACPLLHWALEHLR